ncbi:hypothetical protein ACPUEW_27835, partial [Bacillus sp. II_CA]
LAQQQAALQVEQEPEQDEQDNLQEVDIYQNIITIDDEEVQVIEQPLLDGKMIIRMPKLFSIMSAELASLKYPSERRP